MYHEKIQKWTIYLAGHLFPDYYPPVNRCWRPIVMKFGLAAPDLNPSFWATHYNVFKYEVERKSNGRIQVELIWGGALGSPLGGCTMRSRGE
jgi:TRAP-type C4-dicarboxylate transport system substrate-binding protein